MGSCGCCNEVVADEFGLDLDTVRTTACLALVGAPSEFYLDESLAGRAIRRSLVDLGYTVHTPAEQYGSREAAQGAPRDGDWLAKIGARDWAVVGMGEYILLHPAKLEAYKAAKIYLFLLSNYVKRRELIRLLHAKLREICANATAGTPGVWLLTRSGLERH